MLGDDGMTDDGQGIDIYVIFNIASLIAKKYMNHETYHVKKCGSMEVSEVIEVPQKIIH